MSDECKKSGVGPCIVTFLIGLPVPYVAAFGPSFWIWTLMGQPTWMLKLLGFVYNPLLLSVERWPAVKDYVNWWIALASNQ